MNTQELREYLRQKGIDTGDINEQPHRLLQKAMDYVSQASGIGQMGPAWMKKDVPCKLCKKITRDRGGVICRRIRVNGTQGGCGASVCWRCMKRCSKEEVGGVRCSSDEFEALGPVAWWMHEKCMMPHDKTDYHEGGDSSASAGALPVPVLPVAAPGLPTPGLPTTVPPPGMVAAPGTVPPMGSPGAMGSLSGMFPGMPYGLPPPQGTMAGMPGVFPTVPGMGAPGSMPGGMAAPMPGGMPGGMPGMPTMPPPMPGAMPGGMPGGCFGGCGMPPPGGATVPPMNGFPPPGISAQRT